MNQTRAAVHALLAAIESRDLRRLADRLAPTVVWQNVPHEASVGHTAVLTMLAGIVTWSDEVRWEVVSESYDNERGVGWVERVDRFWLQRHEYAVRCNGVLQVDLQSGQLLALRDYVDLGEWRQRLAPAMQSLAQRSPVEVVVRHLRALSGTSVPDMSADYDLRAEVDIEGTRLHGWHQIADHFEAMRLGPRPDYSVPVGVGPHHVQVDWKRGTELGRDTYEVRLGRITNQTTQRCPSST